MNLRHLIPSCLFAVLLSLTACERTVEQSTPDLTILHTGRLRGNVYPSEFNGAPLQYYPIIASYVSQVREEVEGGGGEVLLVDLGDSLSGSFASFITDGQNVARFFNETGYDAVILGNLDAAMNPDVLQHLEMPVLAPFVKESGQPVAPNVAPVKRLEKGAWTIDLIANFYGDQDPEEFPDRFPTRFGGSDQNVVSVRDYQPWLADLPAVANLVRIFSWFKFESPKEPPTEYLRYLQEDLEVDAIVAQRIYDRGQREVFEQEGFQEWVPPVSVNILRDNRGFTMGRLDLRKVPGGWEVIDYQLVPMTANVARPDPELVRSINEFAEALSHANSELTVLEESLTRAQILDAYLAALQTLPDADGALYSIQSIRADWEAGPLRSSNVYETMPWDNLLVLVRLDPDQVTQVRDSGLFRLLLPADTDQRESVALATSGFFGALLQEQFGIPYERIEGQREFGFFQEALRNPAPLLEPMEGLVYDGVE